MLEHENFIHLSNFNLGPFFSSYSTSISVFTYMSNGKVVSYEKICKQHKLVVYFSFCTYLDEISKKNAIGIVFVWVAKKIVNIFLWYLRKKIVWYLINNGIFSSLIFSIRPRAFLILQQSSGLFLSAMEFTDFYSSRLQLVFLNSTSFAYEKENN